MDENLVGVNLELEVNQGMQVAAEVRLAGRVKTAKAFGRARARVDGTEGSLKLDTKSLCEL